MPPDPTSHLADPGRRPAARPWPGRLPYRAVSEWSGGSGL